MALKASLILPCLAALIFGGCPKPTGPRYVPDDRRSAGLPDSPAELVKLADRLMKKRTIPAIDRARAALKKALPKHQQPIEVRWRQAKACFLMAYRLKNRDQRVSVAQRGIAHARAAIALDAKRVEPHYYLALNIARIAEARSKLTLIKKMVAAAERAREIDATYDRAGPLVFLGKVYLSAPAWPVSVGNSEKAVKLLEKAVKIAPDPLSRLFLGQAYKEEDEDEKARHQLKLALEGPLEDRWRREAEKTLRDLKQ